MSENIVNRKENMIETVNMQMNPNPGPTGSENQGGNETRTGNENPSGEGTRYGSRNGNQNENILRGDNAVPYVVKSPPVQAMRQETEYTKRMKESFGFFGPATFLYAVFYAFCMFQNGSGVTFPFFVAGSLLYLCFCLSKLEISLKKDSIFYMVSMILLGVSTFCTDDGRIIAFNKTGIFFLMMSLLLHQFYDTSKWRLGKYFCSMVELVCCCLGEMGRPFLDASRYHKEKGQKKKTAVYALLGIVISVPLLLIVMVLLGSADAVFYEMTKQFFDAVDFGNILNVIFRITFIFMASYLLTAYLCKKSIREEVKDRRKGDPILAITITGLLSLIYLLFCGIQILYLFLGQMQLPEGYTYAMYARQGFFQLLVVSALNLVIVLVAMSFFRESKILKIILTIMSLCTFIMIASSAMRMIIYIRYYYMTFLRIFVLWALIVLFILFAGVIISIYSEKFPLFRYSMTAVTVLYLLLSFSHPDYIIAKINVANAPGAGETSEEYKTERKENDFFLSPDFYDDYDYLSTLSADAAPVLIPYLEELGYDMELYFTENLFRVGENISPLTFHNVYGHKKEWFGYYYLYRIKDKCENFSLRTYNVSRHMAISRLEKYRGTVIK